jgi:hypothetical protein
MEPPYVGSARAAPRHTGARQAQCPPYTPYTRSAGITLMAFPLSIALISSGVNL